MKMSQSWGDLYGERRQGSCLSVTVDLKNDVFGADPTWVGVAFLIGFLLSVVVAALLVRPCLRSWAKKKEKEAEEREKMGISLRDYRRLRDDKTSTSKSDIVVADIVNGNHQRKTTGKGDNEREVTVDTVDGNKTSSCRGLSDVLLHSEAFSADLEILNQDLDALDLLNNTLIDRRKNVLQALVVIYLNKMKSDGKLTDVFCENFLKVIETEIKNISKCNQKERNDAIEELTKDKTYAKSDKLLDRAKREIDIKQQYKLEKTVKDIRNIVRRDLIKTSGIPENEVDVLMEKLNKNLNNFESKMAELQARQVSVLEHRVHRRRVYTLEKQTSDRGIEDVNDSIANSATAARSTMSTLVENRKMQEKKCEDLIKEHEKYLASKQESYVSDRERYQKELCEKLERRRRLKFDKLLDEHCQELAQVLQSVKEKPASAAEFVKIFNGIVAKHFNEVETMQDELDEQEAQDFEDLKMDVTKLWKTSLSHAANQLAESIHNATAITQGEVQRMMSQYREQLRQLEDNAEKERKDKRILLMERLQQKRQKRDEEKQIYLMEQDTVRSSHEATVKGTLNASMHLDEKIKDRILEDYQRQMQTAVHQLEMSRLRQEKMLERRLLEKRSKLSNKSKQQGDFDQIDIQKRKMDHGNLKMTKEEEMVERDCANEVDELRRNLAAETEWLLRQQDEEVAMVIGSMQLGQARRQAIISRQDETLQQLQDELEKRITENAKLPRSETDQIIQLHYNQVSHLNSQLQLNREQQEKALKRRLEIRKDDMERTLEKELYEERNKEIHHKRNKPNHSAVFNVMSQLLAERRAANKLVEIGADMKLEIEKQKELLNQELEKQLQQELQTQRQDFLTQLAALGNLSKSELNSIVDLAAGGGDKGESRKLAKKLKMSMKQAKDSLAMRTNPGSGGVENFGYDASTDDYDAIESRSAKSRPKSGKLTDRQRHRSYTGHNDDF